MIPQKLLKLLSCSLLIDTHGKTVRKVKNPASKRFPASVLCFRYNMDIVEPHFLDTFEDFHKKFFLNLALQKLFDKLNKTT